MGRGRRHISRALGLVVALGLVAIAPEAAGRSRSSQPPGKASPKMKLAKQNKLQKPPRNPDNVGPAHPARKGGLEISRSPLPPPKK